jgi:hypothetical protein
MKITGSLHNTRPTDDPILMRGRLAFLALFAGLAIAVTGCTGLGTHHARAGGREHGVRVAAVRRPAQAAHPAAVPSAPAAPVTAPPAPAGYRGPHFSTPEAAMNYLATAYNTHHWARLHAITTPIAFAQLMQMRSEAINLRLTRCVPRAGRGDYLCYFTHDYPATGKPGGHAEMIVAPALDPGWYVYAPPQCG